MTAVGGNQANEANEPKSAESHAEKQESECCLGLLAREPARWIGLWGGNARGLSPFSLTSDRRLSTLAIWPDLSLCIVCAASFNH